MVRPAASLALGAMDDRLVKHLLSVTTLRLWKSLSISTSSDAAVRRPDNGRHRLSGLRENSEIEVANGNFVRRSQTETAMVTELEWLDAGRLKRWSTSVAEMSPHRK